MHGDSAATFRIDVFTVFPEFLEGSFGISIIGRAREAGLLDIRVHNPRQWATDPHRSVDDAPFGGGAGMVMMPEPLFAAVEAANPARPLFLLSAAGERFDQRRAAQLAEGGGFSLVCGRYEGVDERVAEHLCDGELSIGDFVLAGGEAAALVVVEAVARLVPGVVGNEESPIEESFSDRVLEYPQYTRPASFRGWDVPEVLRSGDHARVARWRRAQALRRTLDRRPDLLRPDELSAADRAVLDEFPDPHSGPATMAGPSDRASDASPDPSDRQES
ncbi:MAG: tRNA (guanosine(37)-N1)-methyltransferase TrmD [Actinobacteria bacterium]|nr:tRNA (guanosine(37)-N1)-methyltransferase TrmD [Actinomycetota bacterium]